MAEKKLARELVIPIPRATALPALSAVANPLTVPIAGAAPAAAPGIAQRIGDFARAMFPASTVANASVREGAADAAAQGEYARAAGNIVRGAATIPLAAVDDIVGRPVRTVLGGVPPFVGGLVGSRGSTAVAPAPAARAAPASATAASERALTQGRAAAPTITPQDQLSAYIGSVLSQGATIREAQALGGLIPAGASAQPNAKSTVLGQTAQLSQSIYQNAVTQAQELAKTDPEGAQKVVEKATADYFARNAGLVGFDPTKLAQAQLLGGADEEN